MSKHGEKILDAIRQAQSIDELERKWNKAQGRHSNAYWTAEWIDLATARAKILAKFFKKSSEVQK